MNRRAWLGAALAAVAAGCGGGKADVSGKVTYQGKPVVTGTVVVRGPDGIDVNGTIAPDGKYTVQGVAAGAVTIAVVSRDPSHHAKQRAERAAAKKREAGKVGSAAEVAPAVIPWFPLPEKYATIDTSGLTTTLSTGANQFDIVLQ
jgi:hypothetical protein